ncbi:Leucine rich repeat N-terminal domain containing protein [Lotmaria passim]
MAWLNHRLRRMAVAAALLVLCVVDASLVGARTASDYTAAQQASTLQFLQGFVTANPSLSAVWTGTDFCSWSYVTCNDGFGVSLDFSTGKSPYSGTLVLPELGDDVDGSAVIFTDIRVRSMGVRVTGTLPASWGRLSVMRKLYLDGNGLTGTLPSEWSSMKYLEVLYLSTNELTGSIPLSWGQTWTFLFKAALGSNKLCGCLPKQWERNTVFLTITVDPAVRAADCAVKNACDTLPSTSTSTTTAEPEGTTTTTTAEPASTTTTTTAEPASTTTTTTAEPEGTTTTTTAEPASTTTTTTAEPASTTTTTTAEPEGTTTTTTAEPASTTTSGSSSFDASSLSESCEVVSCLACAANRPTACVRCADGYVLASNGTACLLSGDGGFEAPATGLVALLVTALVVISVGVST